jgi:hypothetical protein
MFHCWYLAFWIVGFLGCSSNVYSSWYREECEGQLTWPYHIFSFVWLSYVQLLWSWHPLLCIWALLSVIRGLAVAAIPYLTSDSFCGNSLQDEYLVMLYFTCAAVVLWFFKTILLNVRQPRSVNVDFHSLFLFADVVFSRFVYADITLETMVLDIHNNVIITYLCFGGMGAKKMQKNTK